MRASQGRACWSLWELLAQLWLLNQSSPLSPASLMCAATFLTGINGVNGEVRSVFNNFSQRGHRFFSCFPAWFCRQCFGCMSFQQGLLWLCYCSVSFQELPEQTRTTFPGEMQVIHQGTATLTCKSHRRTVFITTLPLHHENNFFPLFPLVQHDLPSASQTKQGKGGNGGWKQTHLAYTCSDCPDLFAK